MTEHLIETLSSICKTSTDPAELSVHARDWWPLAMLKERRGDPLELPIAVVTPASVEELSEVMRVCSSMQVGVVPFGGGSGVCGGAQASRSVLSLDLSKLNEMKIDETSCTVFVQAGVNGSDFERSLNERGLTTGHFPQSINISTVGGWIATKGVGQLSSRYGRIDQRIVGLCVVLADGSIVRIPARAGTSAGVDLSRLFAGSEGAFGIIADATLTLERVPDRSEHKTFRFENFSAGLDTLRAIMRSQARPSVLRLYDEPDAFISFRERAPGGSVLIVRCEGDDPMFEAELNVVAEIAQNHGGDSLGSELADRWWEHRNDSVHTLKSIMFDGMLGPHAAVDTVEVSRLWPVDELYRRVSEALSRHADVVGCHASHPTSIGTCLYFTFLLNSSTTDDDVERRYHAAWSDAMTATLECEGSITHHHGIGLLRAPWIEQELGESMTVLRTIKAALDPSNIMNPGKGGF